MWISKKEYKFLKENAEKNIDVRATDLHLIEKSLKELELLKERIVELNEKTDTTYAKNHTRCMKDDIERIISHLKVFIKSNSKIKLRF